MTTIKQVNPRKLFNLPTKNPNVMEPATYELLVQAIRKDGFLQPVLVVEEEGGELTIVDGVHRCRAAIEVGLKTIPAVVAPDRARAEILRIGLNKMRGELDLTEIGNQLQNLLEVGFSQEELTLTGFASWEVSALLENAADVEDTDLGGVDTSPAEPTRTKTYNLNLKFDTESDRAVVREFLEAWGDGDILEGISVIRHRMANEEK